LNKTSLTGLKKTLKQWGIKTLEGSGMVYSGEEAAIKRKPEEIAIAKPLI